MYFPDRGAYAPYAHCMYTPLVEGFALQVV